MIESYEFGRMEIQGKTYTSDLILFPDKIKESWWRETGHKLSLKDVEDIFLEDPETIVIGTGYYGLMKVEEEVKGHAKAKGIALIVEKTEKSVESYNAIASKKRTVGAFHLTC